VVQKNLCLQLYRADKFSTNAAFKKYYVNKQDDSNKDYNYIVF